MGIKTEIHVTVGGTVKSGKSRITHLIISALEDAGFEVEISPEVLVDFGGSQLKFTRAMEMDLDKAIIGIEKKSKIVIKNEQFKKTKFK
jgi:hypothetical protein